MGQQQYQSWACLKCGTSGPTLDPLKQTLLRSPGDLQRQISLRITALEPLKSSWKQRKRNLGSSLCWRFSHSVQSVILKSHYRRVVIRYSELLVLQARTFRIIIIHTSVALNNLIKGPSHPPFACSVVPPCEVRREASVIFIFQMWKLRLRALRDVSELPATKC